MLYVCCIHAICIVPAVLLIPPSALLSRCSNVRCSLLRPGCTQAGGKRQLEDMEALAKDYEDMEAHAKDYGFAKKYEDIEVLAKDMLDEVLADHKGILRLCQVCCVCV